MVLKRFLFFFLSSILAPALAWGTFSERREGYKKIILERKLFADPQWLKLGHYHRSWAGAYHSRLQGDFFLAPQGSSDPQAELLATLDALPSLQCRYLARTRWLKSILPLAPEDVVECPERDQWKKQLDAQEAYFVFASSDLNSPGSSFGHTFLRLHKPGHHAELELMDYGVNFAALTGQDTGALFALKGLFGFYPGNYSLLPYHQKIREYTNLEGRDLWEYKLRLSPEEVSFLIDHLLELDGSFSYYYFADENCSFQILELLNILRPELNLTEGFHDFVIPLDTVKLLARESFLGEEKSRTSLQAEWRRRYAGLDAQKKTELVNLTLSPRTFQFTAELSDREKAEVLEAGLSYLAIKEYREQKERKEDKYALAVQRSKLGQVTEAMSVPPPSPPLLALPSQGLYFGYGQEDQQDYLAFKFRRAFHDLLSADTGLSPFFHLEIFSLEFRYFAERKSLDLAQGTLLNVLATAPTNILDHPLSWALDLGTKPKLAPYLDFAAGTSYDWSSQRPTRWTLLARSENRTEDEKYAGYLGVENILITQWNSHVRSLVDVRWLYPYQRDQKNPQRGYIVETHWGISYSQAAREFRLEFKRRENISDWRASYIIFF